MTLIFALIGWITGWLVLWRIPRIRDDSQTHALHPLEDPLPPRFYSLAVIIPARNEERNLPGLLRSLADPNGLLREIIVVDDNSTDHTAEIALAGGAAVIPAGPLPVGWQGKTWACQQGAVNTAADTLLFLDADTWLEPDGLRRILETHRRVTGAISVFPYHEAPTWAEQLSAIFNLLMVAGVGGFDLVSRRPNALFGQMLLVDRAIYNAVGGHTTVRSCVLENVHLAKALRADRVPLHCFSGNGCLSMRMYPNGIRSLIRGWSKGFTSGATQTPLAVLVMAIIWLSGAVTAVAALIRWHTSLACGLYVLFVIQFFVQMRRVGRYWLTTALLYPIPLLFFFAVFARSMLMPRGSVTWKDRVVHAN